MTHKKRTTVREALAASGLFDAHWYLQQNHDVAQAGMDPLAHFCQFGYREDRKPNSYFVPEWYRQQSPKLGKVETNLLLHYLRRGEPSGRQPMSLFNPAWYCATYDVPRGTSALAHFLAVRHSGRFLPCPELYAVPLIAPYCDDPPAGVDPFRHYLDDTSAAGHDAFPDPQVVIDSRLFDANHYLINGSDVHDAELDPAVHYCRYGWREGRKPNMYFDTAWYLRTNPAVARLGINPLVHYILEGEAENRRPVPYFDPGWYRETYSVPPEQGVLAHFLAHRLSQTVSPTPFFDVTWYVAQHATELGSNRDPFAHYLLIGILKDIDPSPAFDAAAYRDRHLREHSPALPEGMETEDHNPLVHHLRMTYR